MVADGLAPVTALGFLKRLTDEVIDDVRHHVVGAPRLRVIASYKGIDALEPIAFVASASQPVSIYTPHDHQLFDLGGIIIHPEFQHQKMGKRLVRDELEQTDADLIGFQTQNMLMLALGHALSEYDFSLSSGLAAEIGSHQTVTQMLGDRLSVVQEGRYEGQSLYGDTSRYEREGMRIPGLNYHNGDAVVFVGKVRR